MSNSVRQQIESEMRKIRDNVIQGVKYVFIGETSLEQILDEHGVELWSKLKGWGLEPYKRVVKHFIGLVDSTVNLDGLVLNEGFSKHIKYGLNPSEAFNTMYHKANEDTFNIRLKGNFSGSVAFEFDDVHDVYFALVGVDVDKTQTIHTLKRGDGHHVHDVNLKWKGCLIETLKSHDVAT